MVPFPDVSLVALTADSVAAAAGPVPDPFCAWLCAAAALLAALGWWLGGSLF